MTANPALLAQLFRDPAITAWNRLEARPRTPDFSRSLRAEVRDPLWFLTRQWQLGELEAEDAASPIDARLLTRQATLDRVRLGAGPAQVFDDSVPLESLVEHEQVPFTHALRVQAGQYLLALHPAALRAKYLPRYRSAFAFAPAGGDFQGDVDGRNLYLATQRLAFDGAAALAAIEAGTFAADVPLDAADVAAMTPVIEQYRRWLARQYSQPEPGAAPVWDAGRLSYSFAAAAPTEGGEQLGLTARRYDEGRLDWFSFELDPGALNLQIADPAYVAPAPLREAISFVPAPATFKGVPNPRFWEMEERQVNFGALNAQTTDQLLLVFAEMGLVYGNDWYVIPYRLPVNTLCEVLGLVVTDVFGDRTVIRAADEGEGSWQSWSLFNLSNAGDLGGYNRQFLLASALGQPAESEPLERVQFVRDETANLVWAIEEVIPAATGQGINGYDAADKTGVLADPIADSPAAVRYLLGNAVPENWIPFIPVQRPGAAQDIVFQRAAMPRLGTPPREVIRAKGALLNEPELPWYVNEEDVPVTGKLLTRAYQRVRWYNGRTCLWIGRRAETGRGTGSSGLRFDQVEPVQAADGPG
ncbi:MAG TPA: hypothetical protein VGX49_13545 [Jatrophihabitans sp.]|nr:hypothetical protein [Jatrophihabitans sp.]